MAPLDVLILSSGRRPTDRTLRRCVGIGAGHNGATGAALAECQSIDFRDARHTGIDWLATSSRSGSPDTPGSFFEPIVDLARGVVAGYGNAGPFDSCLIDRRDQSVAAAARLGYAAALEAPVIDRALAAVPALPREPFCR